MELVEPMSAVSCRAAPEFKRRLNVLAASMSRPAGDLVRDAIEKVYGEAMRRIPDEFTAADQKPANSVSEN